MLNRTAAVLAIALTIMAMQGATLAVAQIPGSWRCSAPGLVSGSYQGGDTAYIHLSGFSTGGSYRVTRRGKTASGVTANGTRFTCSAAK